MCPRRRSTTICTVTAAPLKSGGRVFFIPVNTSVGRVYYDLRNGILTAAAHRGRWGAVARYTVVYLILQTVDLLFARRRGRRLWARTLGLRDGVLGRRGRADYRVLEALR